MCSTLLKRSIFLAFSLVVSARPQIQTPAGPPSYWRIGTVNDWVSSGNYLIYSCGSQASSVQDLLDLTYLYLQTAILSTNTPPYEAFFRTADPAPVTAVLRAITAGTNITSLRQGYYRPIVACANAADRGIRPIVTMCQNSPDAALIQMPETSIVFLCPLFFERTRSPTSDDCDTVNHARTRLIQHTYTAGSQYGFLVEALASMYIRETMPGKAILGGNVREVNACLALPPDQAVLNRASYAYYVSSE